MSRSYRRRFAVDEDAPDRSLTTAAIVPRRTTRSRSPLLVVNIRGDRPLISA